MERIFLRLLFAFVLTLPTPTTMALSSRTEESIRAATFEFLAPSTDSGRESLVGTAFAIGSNEFVTAAHLLDAAVGSHFGHPQLVDSRRVTYGIADILQYSDQKDYVVFTLEHPPRLTPLAVLHDSAAASELYFAGWRGEGRIAIERGIGSGLTRDEESREFDWLRFSGQIWNSLGGGPLLDGSGRVVGIVQARARDTGANYAVPIDQLPIDTDTPSVARIRAMDMLRSLMPVVSVVEPLKGELPLPLSFEHFSQQLQQLRQEYFERTVEPLLEATRGSFVLTGSGAAETCKLLNGTNCQCKGRAGLSGSLVLDNPRADELLVKFGKGEEVTQTIAGVKLSRMPEVIVTGAGPRKRDAIPVAQETYTDFHNRTWDMRTWPLEHQDRVMISLTRKLADGYVALKRTVPTAAGPAGAMQVKFVANLIYYGCEESAAEGFAQLADLARPETGFKKVGLRVTGAPKSDPQQD
jgi:hypothetical protein